ncbi:MAG TPA: FtsX-like permease family protein [Candidatus Dormibacteraeota bacterium]|nr:FtsX-like permease family protein [Candidatus Dormibacteraeota bacterium]
MFKLAYKALIDRKIRSVLTILGITVGSAIILSLIASSAGLNAGIAGNIAKTGANILTIRNAGGFFAAGSTNTYQLSQQDVTYLKSIPGVTSAYPYYSYGANINNGGESIQASVVAIDLVALPALYQGLTLAEGSIPLLGDTTSAAIGWGIANPVSGTPIGLHQMVSMSISGIKGSKGAVSYAVLASGILAQYGTALFANIDDTIYISFQAGSILSKSPYFTGIYVIVDNTDDVATVQNTIETYYSNNVRVISPGQILSSIQGITASLTVFLGSIGAVSLFVATVGIVNTMYVSVMERTREIGILKAIGYRPKQIMGMFLAEAALTGVIGGVCGLALGYALSFLMGGMLAGSTFAGRFGGGGGGGGATIVPVFSTELIVFSLTFPVLLATVAGLYPAWRASRMNAVVALKYE